MAEFLALPDELIPAVVGDPTSQLRYTCRHFYHKIAADLWKITDNLVESPCYSVTVPQTPRYENVVNTLTGFTTCNCDIIYDSAAPFILINDPAQSISCLLIWCKGILPFINKPKFTLYKGIYSCNGDTINFAKFTPKYIPGDLLVVSKSHVSSFLYNHVNEVNRIIYAAGLTPKVPVLIYKKMVIQDFAT